MKKRVLRCFLFGFLAAAAAALPGAEAAGAQASPKSAGDRPNSCLDCHRKFPGKLGAPARKFGKDIHARKGLTCADCHGGDPASKGMLQAMSEKAGFRRKVKAADIPRLCARCHGNLTYMRKFNPSMPVDQYAAYQTSVHGKRLAQGDTKVATCSSCHGAHGILPASVATSSVYPTNVAKTCAKCHADPKYMKEYKIPTDQLSDYTQSIHAELLLVNRDLSAPTCNDCHGNHGAFPPAVRSVSGICGQCHVNNRNLFVKSPHRKAFDKRGLPECVVCHSNHKVLKTSDKMIGGKPPAVCAGCHEEGTKGLRAAVKMRAEIESLKKAIGRANKKLDFVGRKGMDVSEARFRMRGARTALIKLRTIIHSVSIAKATQTAAQGKKVAAAGLQAAIDVDEEFHGRRRWVLLPIVLTLFVAGALYMKLRQIEGENSEDG